jgi:serine/threonine-protein kinase RsbW
MMRTTAKTATLTIAANSMSVRRGLKRLFAAAPLKGLSDDFRGTAEIVMAEALNNIVEHAYAGNAAVGSHIGQKDGLGEIEISVDMNDDTLSCCVIDRGSAMPNLELPQGAPHDLTPGNDLPEGGFGWFLIRSLVQDLRYTRKDNQNLLQFRVVADLNPFGETAA